MNSPPPSASGSRSPPGVDSTGLPATVTRARTCPSPGVTISSTSVVAGSSPRTSGSPRTRLGQRPGRDPGRAVHAGEPAPGPGPGPRGPVRREREHRAAGAVEVAGEDVDDVDQPA